MVLLHDFQPSLRRFGLASCGGELRFKVHAAWLVSPKPWAKAETQAKALIREKTPCLSKQ
jgi:hypothetical protein